MIEFLALQGMTFERKKFPGSRKIGVDVFGYGNRNSEGKGPKPEKHLQMRRRKRNCKETFEYQRAHQAWHEMDVRADC